MAPEVAQDLDHGLSSDVHSFAMVLWQICTLEKPYAVAVSSQFLHQLLVKEKRRPQLHRIQSNTIKDLLALAWHPDPNLRPTFDHITTVLQDTTK
jgi:serine/threonine-protein kinase TNNI3K